MMEKNEAEEIKINVVSEKSEESHLMLEKKEEEKKKGKNDEEKEPLRKVDLSEKKEEEEVKEITVEEGLIKDSEREKSKSPLPPKKGCDLRCLVIGILVLVIMVGGAAVAILAHRFKNESSFEFAFASYFGDNMVLQRAPQRAIIWGYGPLTNENATLLLTIEGTTDLPSNTIEYRTTVKNTAIGMIWKIVLNEMTESGPFIISAQLDEENSMLRKIQLKNVLFGDVWICAGQENMQFSVDKLLNGSEETSFEGRDEDFQKIRLLSLFPSKSNSPLFNIRSVQLPWSPPSKNSLFGSVVPDNQMSSYFSSICWLYGKQLYNRLQYPIGLISVTYSNSMIDEWVSALALDKCNIVETQSSSKIWNAMVNPLLEMSHFGFIWYQGEKDALDGPRNYNCVLVELISQWREELYRRTQGSTDRMLPVGIVQLAPNREANHLTYGYTDIRWRQTANYGFLPNPLLKKVFMAVTIDLPDLTSPYGSVLSRYKHDVANRLVLGALGVAYRQKDIHFQGPFPTNYSINIQDHQLTLYFDSFDIKVQNETGFEVCCSDNRTLFCPSSFIKVSYAPGREWVEASIVSNSSSSISMVWSNCQDKHIVGFRYLWRETPCGLHSCAIYETTDLPMAPFIHFGLIDDSLTHQLNHEPVNLI